MPARTTVDGALLRTAYRLEGATLAWNVAGTVVLVLAAAAAGSVALVAFALDSLLEIGASAVVIWELRGGGHRQERALRLLGAAFACWPRTWWCRRSSRWRPGTGRTRARPA